MRIQALTGSEVLMSLISSDRGLSDSEAAKRLREYGPNEIRQVRSRSLLLRFASQFTHFLAILLWIAAGLCFLSEYLKPGEGMLLLGIAVIAVILINALFTFVQEYRAEKALDALKALLPYFVTVVRASREKQIQAREVVPGDRILLSEGDKVPADARLIDGTAMKVSNASLTGESDAVSRDARPFEGERTRSPNIVFAGTTVVSGSGKAVVFATGMSTEFGSIAHLTSGVESGLSPLQRQIVRTTRLVAAIAAGVGIVFFLLGFGIGRTFWHNFIFAVGITVALIPEGMLPTVTLALAMGSQRMAKRKALIKTLTSVETLGSVTVICTDKTGTLTQNRMTAVRAWCNRTTIEIRDAGEGDVSALMTVAALCNNAREVDDEYRGDPTEVALLRAAKEHVRDLRGERKREIPFDPERKRMTTVYAVGGKTVAFSKGAMEGLVPRCNRLLWDGKESLMDEAIRQEVTDTCHSMMDQGLRVLCFARREVEHDEVGRLTDAEIEDDMVFVGLIGLEDPPRPEVVEAVARCREAGIKVVMITGDGSRTAVAVAREIDLIKGEPVVIEGAELEGMSDRDLGGRLRAPEVIFARMTPKHKLRVVAALKDEGEIVAVTGDGVNDAPALKKADIGIAMGVSGTDVAKEAADVVLLDDNFATIVNAVEEGRAVFENIRKFITYIFASNIPEAVPYLAYILFRIPLPLTVMQILAVDLGTDMLPALALGSERPVPGVMKQPPRPPSERLIHRAVITRAYLIAEEARKRYVRKVA